MAERRTGAEAPLPGFGPADEPALPPARRPLAARMRPRSLAEVVGHAGLLGPEALLPSRAPKALAWPFAATISMLSQFFHMLPNSSSLRPRSSPWKISLPKDYFAELGIRAPALQYNPCAI